MIIPIGGKWALRTQGNKLLSHAVDLKSIRFNPFLWRLSLYGFKIIDNEKNIIAGFDRLSVDFSFARLLKKEYRV